MFEVITNRSTHPFGQTQKIWSLLLHGSTLLGKKLQINPPSETWKALCWGYWGERALHTKRIVMGIGTEVSYCIQHQAWWSLKDCPRKQQRQQLSEETPPNTLLSTTGTAQCSGVRSPHLHLPPITDSYTTLLTIKLNFFFAISDVTTTSASSGMCLTDLICASHLINSLSQASNLQPICAPTSLLFPLTFDPSSSVSTVHIVSSKRSRSRHFLIMRTEKYRCA